MRGDLRRYGGYVAAIALLILGVWAFWIGDLGARIMAMATLIVAIATSVYAWLTYQSLEQARASSSAAVEGNSLTRELVQEFRKAREQAATPALRVLFRSTSGNSAHGTLTNISQTPAEKVQLHLKVGSNVSIVVHGTQKGSLVGGEALNFELDLSSVKIAGVDEYIFTAEFENLFSERFESVTTFPIDPQTRMPQLKDHGFDTQRVK